jgi:hypothetical protein
MTLDTLEYVKRLEAAGVDRRQAEAHAAAVRDTLAPQLATKADLDAAVARLEAKISSEFGRIEAKLSSEAGRLDNRITRLEGKLLLVQWMLGFNLAVTTAVLWRLLLQ